MAKEKEILVASEQSSVLNAVYGLIMTCPFVKDIDINFDMLDTEKENIAVLSTPGASVLSRNIMGGFRATLPFLLGYRGKQNNAKRKIKMVDLLNNMGKWLGKEEVTVEGERYMLEEYPGLSEGRLISKIEQQTVPYIHEADEHGNVTYVCTINVQYSKEEE